MAGDDQAGEGGAAAEHKSEFGQADGWSARYATGETPWDQGGPHPELVRRVERGELSEVAGGRAWVPGCGRGHDALFLAHASFEVTAVDFADGVDGELAPRLAALGSRFVRADALEYGDVPFALVFEHTFFCALDPRDRPRWGAQMQRLVDPGGLLAALVFPADKPREQGGPPHGTTAQDLAAALGPGFRLAVDEPVERRIARRDWAERWAVFERVVG
ncbi:MAG: methyltransferase domain-containing protein [Planctomycetota bacterium]